MTCSAGASAHAAVPRDRAVVAAQLHQKFDSKLTVDVVSRTVEIVADRFTAATVRSFVPLLVSRYAGGQPHRPLRRTDHRRVLTTVAS